MAASVKSLTSIRQDLEVSEEREAQKAIKWTFLTNQTHVLLCLYRNDDQRLRDVAAAVGITERMVQRIIVELVEAGYLKVLKVGRRNRYVVNAELRLRHPMENHHTIGELLDVIR